MRTKTGQAGVGKHKSGDDARFGVLQFDESGSEPKNVVVVPRHLQGPDDFLDFSWVYFDHGGIGGGLVVSSREEALKDQLPQTNSDSGHRISDVCIWGERW